MFGSWLGCGSDVWVVSDGVDQWWLGFLAWVTVVVVVFFFFRLGPVLKGVVGYGWVRCLGRGWVVAEVGRG